VRVPATIAAAPLALIASITFGGCSQLLGIENLDGPCTVAAGCGDGEVCDMSAPGGSTCIDSDGDLDNDGIPNTQDFCHHAPGGKFDEDQDGLGDECDPCPIARPPATPDTDGDGVDSPCDPEPGIAGDQITAFSGFNAGLPPGWIASGPWEARGGEVVITAPDPTTTFTLTAPLPLLSAHVAVLGQYRIDRVDAAATQNRAGVTAIDIRPAGMSVVTCGGSRSGGTDSVLLDTDAGASSQAFTNLFDPASLYRVAERIDNAQGACAMIADAQTTAVQQATLGEKPSQGGLVVRGVTARFQYLLVIQRKP
jgi:hypothetical protein